MHCTARPIIINSTSSNTHLICCWRVLWHRSSFRFVLSTIWRAYCHCMTSRCCHTICNNKKKNENNGFEGIKKWKWKSITMDTSRHKLLCNIYQFIAQGSPHECVSKLMSKSMYHGHLVRVRYMDVASDWRWFSWHFLAFDGISVTVGASHSLRVTNLRLYSKHFFPVPHLQPQIDPCRNMYPFRVSLFSPLHLLCTSFCRIKLLLSARCILLQSIVRWMGEKAHAKSERKLKNDFLHQITIISVMNKSGKDTLCHWFLCWVQPSECVCGREEQTEDCIRSITANATRRYLWTLTPSITTVQTCR